LNRRVREKCGNNLNLEAAMIWLLFLLFLVVGVSGLLGGIGTTIFLMLIAAIAVAGIITLLRGRRSVLR
jgi:hypothetical protein